MNIENILLSIFPPLFTPPPPVGTKNEAERIAWLERTLQKLPIGDRILDAGAGELQFKKFCSHLNYVAQDFGRYDGKGDGKSLQTEDWEQSNLDIVSDIINIPEPDNSFDDIMCVEVLEHLPDPTLAIKEFSRLLKASGKLILTAPFCSLTHFSPFHFFSGFNTYWYEKHLADYGFKIIEIEQNGNYFEYLGQELRRLESIAEKYTTESVLKKYNAKAIGQVLNFLQKCTENDIGSKDVLCFGCFVLAEKI
jgi:ubiquinone/menaquinone biosynthesis C-methylase UbiE